MKMGEFAAAIDDGATRAKALLTCPDCGVAEDFDRHPDLKGAMIQIDKFKSTHTGCGKQQTK